jgi:hypothetical protein
MNAQKKDRASKHGQFKNEQVNSTTPDNSLLSLVKRALVRFAAAGWCHERLAFLLINIGGMRHV